MQCSKQKGTMYEMLFIAECMKRGLHPHDSPGDYLAHDSLVLNNAGKVFRVQVKGTNTSDERGSRMPRYRVTAKSSNTPNHHGLDCTKVDVLAAYVGITETWYIIPCLKVEARRAVWLFPSNPDSKGQFEKYKDNWDYFF